MPGQYYCPWCSHTTLGMEGGQRGPAFPAQPVLSNTFIAPDTRFASESLEGVRHYFNTRFGDLQHLIYCTHLFIACLSEQWIYNTVLACKESTVLASYSLRMAICTVWLMTRSVFLGKNTVCQGHCCACVFTKHITAALWQSVLFDQLNSILVRG